MIRKILLCLLLGNPLLAQESETPTMSQEDSLAAVALRNPEHLGQVVQGNNAFAFDLYKKLKSRKGNLFFSPYSIANGFAMLGLGAKGNTASEFSNVFHYPMSLAPLNGDLNEILSSNSTDRMINQISIATAIWLQKGVSIAPSYQQSLVQNFKITLEPVDFNRESFKAIKVINDWVSLHTKGKINQLLNPSDVNSDTRLVLTTAIHMNGNWESPFDLLKTSKAPFHISEKHSNTVEMMHTSARFGYMNEDDMTMVELPYRSDATKGAALKMYVLLPNTVTGLDKLEDLVNENNWDKWMKGMQSQKINLSLPRFHDEQRIDLNQAMESLGLIQAFSAKADFSGISLERGLMVNKAIHKTYIRIDEKGTEAAAATAIAVGVTSVVTQKPIEVNVDHPFLFIIADKKTGSILFIGRVAQP